MSYGAQIKFAIGRQSAVGSGGAVTAAGSFHHVPLVSEDIGLEKAEVVSANLTGRFEQGAVYDGVSRIAGTLEFEPEPWSVGAVLDAAVNRATGVASGSMKNFTFLPRTADYSPLFCNEPYTIYAQFSDASSAEHFFDCQFNGVDFTFAQGQLLRARASVVGGRRVETGVGSLGITLHTADALKNWLWDVTSVSYGGNGISNMSEVTVSLNENIEAQYSLDGTLLPYKYARSGFREVTVSGTFYFSDRTILNDFVAGTQKQLIITARNLRANIQSGYYATLKIDVPQLKITQFKPGVSGPGEVSVQFTGRGITDPTSAYAVQYFLLNTYANANF
jgi:hypothetical protein